MSELSRSPVSNIMQEKSLEVLGLEARNEKLRHNIERLETENSKLKSEASLPKEEMGGFTKKIEEIEDENNRLFMNFSAMKVKNTKLLSELNEIKQEKKGRDDKIRELEKQVESQKSELAGAYYEMNKTKKENEIYKKTLIERLSKSRIEVKEIESNIANLEAQNPDLKKRLDEMEKNCQTQQQHHNKILGSSTSLGKFFVKFKAKVISNESKTRELTK